MIIIITSRGIQRNELECLCALQQKQRMASVAYYSIPAMGLDDSTDIGIEIHRLIPAAFN